ncbi:MAG: RHS repeat-associated core domain-containing protein [Oscillospiraceae bacterium]|nr:RHS repeat-associated core domain-containing protein [Oscillospiraceae bacterium]
MADINPLRYRGYYYDQETGLYHLWSRYYDPQTGRFISPDSYASTGQGPLGYNMFAYCKNNPVNYADPSGNAAFWTTTGDVNPFLALTSYLGSGGGGGGSASAAVSGVTAAVQRKTTNFDNSSEEDVLNRVETYGVAFYKGVLVVKTQYDASYSFGFIGISHLQLDSDTLKHEYGHTVQLKNMGVGKYIVDVVIPSITINLLERQGKLPYDYYSYPWEAEANALGNAILSQEKKNHYPKVDILRIGI